MRSKNRLGIVLFLLVAFLAVFSSHRSFAQTASAISTMCGTASTNSSGFTAYSTNTIDTTVTNNRNAFQQYLFSEAHNISTKFPLVPAYNQCLQNLVNLMTRMPGLADPLNVAGTAVTSLLMNVLNQACSSVMGEITSAENAVSQLAKVCLPMPKFGGLDLPTFHASSCSGDLQLNMISGFSAPQQPSYTYSQFQSQP